MLIRILLGALLFCSTTANAEITVCKDEAEFPPFIYTNEAGSRVGLTIELLEHLSESLDMPIKTVSYPWDRCLLLVSRGEIDVLVDSYYDSDRAKTLHYTQAYYQLSPQVFYDVERFPEGLQKSSVSELRQYNGCGLQGYSYQHYGEGQETLTKTALSQDQLFKQLLKRRCDYVLEELEIIKGFALTGNDMLGNDRIKHFSPDGTEPPSLHMVYSKKNPISDDLVEKLNQAIVDFRTSGKAAEIMSRLLKEP